MVFIEFVAPHFRKDWKSCPAESADLAGHEACPLLWLESNEELVLHLTEFPTTKDGL